MFVIAIIRVIIYLENTYIQDDCYTFFVLLIQLYNSTSSIFYDNKRSLYSGLLFWCLLV